MKSLEDEMMETFQLNGVIQPEFISYIHEWAVERHQEYLLLAFVPSAVVLADARSASLSAATSWAVVLAALADA